MGDLYCIEVTTELDGVFIMHKRFDSEPTRLQVLEVIMAEDTGYDDDYGRFVFYKVRA